jgi:hypothetical protein
MPQGMPLSESRIVSAKETLQKILFLAKNSWRMATTQAHDTARAH